ncbi:MAG TPA: DCC1-like thiol-disulfide oxidoreductase family protein [Polyangiaceae bacterium]|nr:DCC1-like thiol-disulfide oxidoreductase family protein [Polyangiaceae bacterium]
MTGTAELLAAGPILLYDGSCGVCSRTVQWVLAHERAHTLRFAPLESAVGQELRARAGIADDVDSLLWMEQGAGQLQAATHSSAALRVVDYVGGPWRLLGALRIVPRFLRDAAYRAFARVRHRVAAQHCLLPTPEERARFIAT